MIEIPIFVWIAVTIWIFTRVLVMLVTMSNTIEATKRMTDGE